MLLIPDDATDEEITEIVKEQRELLLACEPVSEVAL